MHVSYTVTLDDLILLNAWIMRKEGDYQQATIAAAKSTTRISIILLIVTVAGMLAVTSLTGGLPLLILLVLTIGLIAFMVYLGHAAKSTGKHILRTLADRHLLGPLPREGSACLDDEEIRFTSHVADELIRWPYLRAIEETPDLLVFQFTALAAHAVPTRAFPTPQAARDFAHRARLLKQQHTPASRA